MHIFIDESGSFATAHNAGSFCVVVAYVVPESELSSAVELLDRWKKCIGLRSDEEPKPRSRVSDDAYFALLRQLAALDCVTFAVVTDSGLNIALDAHRNNQSDTIRQKVEDMIYPGGKIGVHKMAEMVINLSPQQWVEMVCRAHLVANVVRYAIAYYSLRKPETLSSFRWYFDAKDGTSNRFDQAFDSLTLPFTQTMMLERPIIMVSGGDYSAFEPFYHEGTYPTWLPNVREEKKERFIDAQKIWRERTFVDSRMSPGVQLVDLIANGTFRLLNQRYSDQQRAGASLAPLFLQPERGDPIFEFIAIGPKFDIGIGRTLSRLIRQMEPMTKRMLTPDFRRRNGVPVT